jgi:hypothetical protein
MSHIPSDVGDQCFRVLQRAWGGQTVSNVSFRETGRTVSAAISLLESKMAKAAHKSSLEEDITLAIKDN